MFPSFTKDKSPTHNQNAWQNYGVHQIMKHNFIPSILILASGMMALHYSTIIQSSECPTTIANGASHTGKSTTMNVVLSITGMLLFSLWFLHYTISSGLPREAIIYELNKHLYYGKGISFNTSIWCG